jgi:hypothetical protein
MPFEDSWADTPIGRFKRRIGYREFHYVDAQSQGVYRFEGGHGRKHFVARDPRWWFTTNLHDIIALLEFGKCDGIDYNLVNHQYGNVWANRAVAFAIPMAFVKGLHGLIRLLPALPAPRRGIPNVLMLWGFFAGADPYCVEFSADDNPCLNPCLFEGDHSHGNYGNPGNWDDQRELVRATMALAHAVGYKVILAMPMMSGQYRRRHGDSGWYESSWSVFDHYLTYYGKLLHAMQLDVDGAYMDMGKWSGGFFRHDVAHPGDLDGRACGVPIPYVHMQKLTWDLQHTVHHPLGFIGQACPEEPRYGEMGYHGAFTYKFGDPNLDVGHVSGRQSGHEFRAGYIVTDNDMGGADWGVVDDAINRGIFDQPVGAECPILFSLKDLFPLCVPFSDVVRHNLRWDHERGLFLNGSWERMEYVHNRFRLATFK